MIALDALVLAPVFGVLGYIVGWHAREWPDRDVAAVERHQRAGEALERIGRAS